ncbi:MAG: lysoplasmalogenase [Cellulophaga sp.]
MNTLKPKSSTFFILFTILVLLDLYVGINNDLGFRQITKPLILISLLLYFGINGKKLPKKVYYLVLFGLFFSLLGDVFLLYDQLSSNYFILGLLSFLTAHICYSIAFYKQKKDSINRYFWIVLLLFLSYGLNLFLLLKDELGDLMLPVIIYIIAILFLAVMAFLRKGNVSKSSFTLVFFGALFFIASDSILAINKFLKTIPYAHLYIMSTYAIAQYLIVSGMLKSNNSKL